MRHAPLPDLPTEWVDAFTIRAAFNEARIWEQALAGAFRIYVHPAHPCDPALNRPLGTMSEMIWVLDTAGRIVAIMHRLRHESEDELYGGDRPDPKRVVIGGRMLAVRSRR